MLTKNGQKIHCEAYFSHLWLWNFFPWGWYGRFSEADTVFSTYLGNLLCPTLQKPKSERDKIPLKHRLALVYLNIYFFLHKVQIEVLFFSYYSKFYTADFISHLLQHYGFKSCASRNCCDYCGEKRARLAEPTISNYGSRTLQEDTGWISLHQEKRVHTCEAQRAALTYSMFVVVTLLP